MAFRSRGFIVVVVVVVLHGTYRLDVKSLGVH